MILKCFLVPCLKSATDVLCLFLFFIPKLVFFNLEDKNVSCVLMNFSFLLRATKTSLLLAGPIGTVLLTSPPGLLVDQVAHWCLNFSSVTERTKATLVHYATPGGT